MVALVAGAGLLFSGCAAPAPAATTTAPATQKTGDAELLRLIRPSFTGKADRVAVAVIEDGEVREAFLRADAATVFEIGSISKVFTGELLAEAIDRGEVRADDPIGDHLDLGEAPIASATLRDLAAHASGLPTFPTDPEWVEQERRDGRRARRGRREPRTSCSPRRGRRRLRPSRSSATAIWAPRWSGRRSPLPPESTTHAGRRTPVHPAGPRRRVGAAR